MRLTANVRTITGKPIDAELRLKALEGQMQAVLIALSAIQDSFQMIMQDTQPMNVPIIGTISTGDDPRCWNFDYVAISNQLDKEQDETA